MESVTHLEKVITGEVPAVTHLERVITEEAAAVTYTEKVIAGEAPPVTHLQKVIAGEADPVTHLEYVWAGRTPEPTEHEYTGAVPVTFTADGTPLLDYLISGNTVQNGTPTPDNPIIPEGTGDRTTNEWNVTILPNSAITEDSKWQKYDSSVVSTTMYMSCEANTTYYLYTPSSITSGIFRVYTSTSNEIPIVGSYSITVNEKIRSSSPISVFKFTTGANDKMIIIQVTTANSQTMADNAILDRGYKTPISSANTTTPVYLGEVETTRKIMKLVLDGTEDWAVFSDDTKTYGLFDAVPTSVIAGEGLCTHYTVGTGTLTLENEAFYVTANKRLYIRDTNCETLTALKTYLAQQYAAGTPVTVWYVLATPETAVVNDPLMKIGDYADTLSMEQAGVQIPTNNGSTTVDVETTLKPSEVYIKYMG